MNTHKTRGWEVGEELVAASSLQKQGSDVHPGERAWSQQLSNAARRLSTPADSMRAYLARYVNPTVPSITQVYDAVRYFNATAATYITLGCDGVLGVDKGPVFPAQKAVGLS